MTSRLAAALKAHRHLKGPRVLYSDDKSTADRDALSSWIKRAERRAGLPITGRLHILRHTFCSRLAIRGATTKAIPFAENVEHRRIAQRRDLEPLLGHVCNIPAGVAFQIQSRLGCPPASRDFFVNFTWGNTLFGCLDDRRERLRRGCQCNGLDE